MPRLRQNAPEFRTRYYDSGEIYMVVPVINGNVEGILKFYYRSGTVEKEVPYVNNYIHGTKREYFPSGRLRGEFLYENDELLAIKTFLENGQIDVFEIYSS